MSSKRKTAGIPRLGNQQATDMKCRFFAFNTFIVILSVILLSCASSSLPSREYLSHEDCERLATVPDSFTVDTLGIVGTIFPPEYTAPGDSTNRGPYSTWTPSKKEILLAEQIFKRHIKNNFRCIDSGYASFYRQYAGRGVYNNCILIHGIRMSRESTICGYRSFWINIYDSGCSIFNAMVDITLGTCVIDLEENRQ
jgi:hypothetical protein